MKKLKKHKQIKEVFNIQSYNLHCFHGVRKVIGLVGLIVQGLSLLCRDAAAHTIPTVLKNCVCDSRLSEAGTKVYESFDALLNNTYGIAPLYTKACEYYTKALSAMQGKFLQ